MVSSKRKAPPTPFSSSKRRKFPTPRLGNAAFMARALGGKATAYVASKAAKAVPGIGTAISAAAIAKEVYDMMKSQPPRRRQGQKYMSAGKIKANRSVKKLGSVEKHTELGIVTRNQLGDIAVATPEANVLYIAQSSMPIQTMSKIVLSALLKRLALIAGMHVKDCVSHLTDNQYYNGIVEYRYKLRDGTEIVTQNFTVTAGSTTLENLTDAVFNFFNGLAGGSSLPVQSLTLRYYIEFGTTVSAKTLLADMDLTNVTVRVDAESIMRLQNRTVSINSNDQADDVDNVPLRCKFFQYDSNGTMYRDYATAQSKSNLTTDPIWGVLPTVQQSIAGTQMYKELPYKSQIVGCKSTGDFMFQPGTIRTSRVKNSLSVSFNKYIAIAFTKSSANTGALLGKFERFYVGSTRLHAFDKEILAVATGSESEDKITVAWQHNLEIGCTVYHRRSNQTAPIVLVTTGSTIG